MDGIPLRQNHGSTTEHVASAEAAGGLPSGHPGCPLIKQEQAKLVTALPRPGRNPPKRCFWLFRLAWGRQEGKLTLQLPGASCLRITNTSGSSASPRKPCSSRNFSLFVVDMDTELKKQGARRGRIQGVRRLSSQKGKEIVQSPIKTKQERLRSRQA